MANIPLGLCTILNVRQDQLAYLADNVVGTGVTGLAVVNDATAPNIDTKAQWMIASSGSNFTITNKGTSTSCTATNSAAGAPVTGGYAMRFTINATGTPEHYTISTVPSGSNAPPLYWSLDDVNGTIKLSANMISQRTMWIIKNI